MVILNKIKNKQEKEYTFAGQEPWYTLKSHFGPKKLIIYQHNTFVKYFNISCVSSGNKRSANYKPNMKLCIFIN